MKQAKDWEDFLRKMQNLGYEVNHGKHIALKAKGKERFTRAKTIGKDYTKGRLKEEVYKELKEVKFKKKSIEMVINIDLVSKGCLDARYPHIKIFCLYIMHRKQRISLLDMACIISLQYTDMKNTRCFITKHTSSLVTFTL